MTDAVERLIRASHKVMGNCAREPNACHIHAILNPAVAAVELEREKRHECKHETRTMRLTCDECKEVLE